MFFKHNIYRRLILYNPSLAKAFLASATLTRVRQISNSNLQVQEIDNKIEKQKQSHFMTVFYVYIGSVSVIYQINMEAHKHL